MAQMDKNYKRAIDFLKSYQMDASDINPAELIDAFLDQMQRGLEGKKSSLAMLPTYLTPAFDVPSDKPVLVADAGGTNFRSAIVWFDENKKPVIEKLNVYKMPGVEKPVDKQEFFAQMARYVQLLTAQAQKMGFCFSYPVEMLPDKDGKILHFSKEIKVSGIGGQLVGKGLQQALKQAGATVDHIVLLNDTVAVMLAGCGYQNRQFGGFIGFILGTGTNCCYCERNSAIKKIKSDRPDESQIINIESGGMTKVHRGKLDLAYDKTTQSPGFYPFEKMIAGAYLGGLFSFVLAQAAKDRVIDGSVKDDLISLPAVNTKAMNDFLLYPYGDNLLADLFKSRPSDAAVAFGIADRLVERAAKLTACNLSAVVLKSGQGKDPSKPVAIVAEGTTFYHLRLLKARTEFYLKQILEQKYKRFVEVISVDNATLIGAAIAGLTN